MYTPLISVIVPIYNVSPDLLNRCINSIYSQDYQRTEIIIIDDGSRDEYCTSYESILREYQGLNLRYYHQTNAGVSAARNKGIEIATGEYIAFVDGDDVITKSFLPEATALACEKADLIIGSMRYADARLNEETDENIVNKSVKLTGEDILQLQLALVKGKSTIDYRSNRLFGSPCARLYRTDICKTVKFPDGVTNLEDQLFNREFFRHISSAYLVPNIWYIYYQYSSSAMHYTKTANNYFYKMLPFWNGWHTLNLSEDPRLKSAVYDYTIALFNSATEHMLPERNYKECKQVIDKILEVGLFGNICKEVGINELSCFKHKLTYLFIRYKLYIFIILSMKVKQNGIHPT